MFGLLKLDVCTYWSYPQSLDLEGCLGLTAGAIRLRDHERSLREVQQELAEQGTRKRAAREDLLSWNARRTAPEVGGAGDPFDRQDGSSRGGARGLDLPCCRQCALEGAAASDLQAVQSLVICLTEPNHQLARDNKWRIVRVGWVPTVPGRASIAWWGVRDPYSPCDQQHTSTTGGAARELCSP